MLPVSPKLPHERRVARTSHAYEPRGVMRSLFPAACSRQRVERASRRHVPARRLARAWVTAERDDRAIAGGAGAWSYLGAGATATASNSR